MGNIMQIVKISILYIAFFLAHESWADFIGFQPESLSSNTFFVTEPGAILFANNSNYNYTPISLAASSPMIKIVASDVVIDFQNIGIYNTDNSSAGWTGIEIGWTPAEILADPSRIQPNNITIKNLSLYNFDAGILIHAGVQSVRIKNCNLYDIALGVGVLGTSTQLCQDLKMNDVSLFGYGDHFHTALVNMKSLIETTHGYGANYFMPLKSDPLNANSVDVYTYFGMWVNHLMIADIQGLGIHKIGYPHYQAVSEGNGMRSEGIGLRIQNSTRFVMKNVITSEVFSELKAVGLQLDAVNEIEIHNSSFSYNSSALKSVGIEVSNSLNLPYSAQAIQLYTVATKSNMATNGIAIGMDVSSVRGLRGTGITSKYNMGSLASYGLYSNSLYTVDLRDSTFSENTATRVINDVATTQGIVAAAFYGTNVNSMQISNVDFSSTQALNTAYGLYLNNSTSCQFWNCRFVANVTTSMRSGEAAAIRLQQDGQEISKHGPCVPAASTGAYGVCLIGSKYLKFEQSSALSNSGHRAFGFSVQNCRAVALWDCFASTQSATGQMLDSTFLTDNVARPTAIPIISYHKQLLFGDVTKTTIDAVSTTDLFLSALSTIRAAQIAGNTPTYTDITTLLATSSLLQAMIARYRLWGVAMGVQAHNVTGFILKNCTCTGQVSLFDSAVGIAFTGRNTGHAINNCDLSFNVGGYASLQTATTNPSALYTNSYNLIGFAPFWKTLFMNQTPWSILTSASFGNSVTAVEFSPDGTMLAIGTADNNVRIYNTSTWALLQTLTGHTTPIAAVSWRPDGMQLATCDSASVSNIKIWNTTSWALSQNLTHSSGVVRALAWNPNGSLLASAGTGVAGNNIQIWNSTSWVNSNSLSHGAATVQALAWSPDGTTLVSGSSDNSNNLMVWNTASWKSTNTLSGHSAGVTSLSYNSNGSLLASGSTDTTVKIWDGTAWNLSQTLSASAGAVNAVRFKPDGKLLAAAYASNVLKVWKTSSWGTIEATLTDATNSALCLAWNNTGRLLATGSSDGLYRIYNTNIWKTAATTNDIGIYTGSSNFIAQDSLLFGKSVDDNSIFVDLKGTQRHLASPIGPVGAGMIMGDMMMEGIIQNSSLYGNMGNAGHAYGIFLDKAFSVTVENNLISGNSSNVHGFVRGAMDVTTSTPNLYVQNTFEGNKCSIYNNANYIIPFNPADPNHLSLPIKRILNGNYSNVTTTLGYENVVIEYSLDETFFPYEGLSSNPIDSSLRSYLTSAGCWA